MTPTQVADATTWLAAMPRAIRKAYRPERKALASRNSISHDAVDSYMRTEYRTDTYHIQNFEFLDRAYDYDEFGDVDSEFAGLTIVEPMTETELFAFCTGYDNI
jgi:hypothetical protein